ncbi:MAG: 30S ribosome-binding factor RbfA [Bdellovibrionales bacterium]
MQERSQRQLRVGEQIRHVIAECLAHGNFTDEVLYHNTQNIMVSEVRISPDLKNATAFIYTLGGKDFEPILQSMNNEAKVFQKYVGQKLSLKFTPKIRFKEDSSFDNAHHIESLLHEIKQEKKFEE